MYLICLIFLILTPVLAFASSCSQLTLRHIEAGGVGYNHGYTSGEALVVLNSPSTKWICPLVDIRIHQFNNNAQAANAGVGFRFVSSNKAFGFHTFYDYRNTPHHFNYNQVGVGFEFFGERFDVRLNGYLPVGKTHHTLFHCDFDEVLDNFPSVKRVEVALRGVNLEFGAIIKKTRRALLYAAIGPYYFGGNVCHHPIGGKFRLRASPNRYFFIEGSISYDQVFKTRAQGLIGMALPIGCKPKTSRSSSLELLTQPIERFEMVVLDKNCWWRK